MIEERRKARQPTRPVFDPEASVPRPPFPRTVSVQWANAEKPEQLLTRRCCLGQDDDLFTGIDEELSALKASFFATGEDGQLAFDTEAAEQQKADGAAMHKFKYMSPTLKNVRSTE